MYLNVVFLTFFFYFFYVANHVGLLLKAQPPFMDDEIALKAVAFFRRVQFLL
jgi:hypothetical protein